ncbi:MAG TPA: hypothetical protein VN803_03975 [Gemmatimonadales bacterium]|nr:hypothetical protein [Gemmatimonadales bacterium]
MLFELAAIDCGPLFEEHLDHRFITDKRVALIAPNLLLNGHAPAPDVAATPSGLPPPDPIFAAIESHRRAYAALDAFVPELADIEQAAWHAPRGRRRAANRRLKQAYAEERRLGETVSDAADRFAATVSDTLPGAVAALDYVRAHHAQGYPMCDEQEDFVKLLGSIETTICHAAGLPMPRLGRKFIL